MDYFFYNTKKEVTNSAHSTITILDQTVRE